VQPEAKACYLAHFNAKHMLSVNCAALAPERGLRAFYSSQELKPPPVQGELLAPVQPPPARNGRVPLRALAHR
jgi:hypothetical protein